LILGQIIRPERVPERAARLSVRPPTSLRQRKDRPDGPPLPSQTGPTRHTGLVYPLGPLGLRAGVSIWPRDSLPLGLRMGQWYREVREHQPRVGIPKLWADAYGTGVALLALRFIFCGGF